MAEFEHQVAGHKGNIALYKDKIIKKSTHLEQSFYESCTHPITQVIAKYHGTMPFQFPDGIHTGLILDNVIHEFKYPNLLDLKLGKILYGNDASEEKKLRMIEQANITTSASCGIRICGMKLYNPTINDYEVYDKSYGRSLTKDTLNLGFIKYFTNAGEEVKNKMIQKVKEIINVVEQIYFRCGGVSLLMAYEIHTKKVVAILMDFAHTEFMEEKDGIDTDLLWGLQSVLNQLNKL